MSKHACKTNSRLRKTRMIIREVLEVRACQLEGFKDDFVDSKRRPTNPGRNGFMRNGRHGSNVGIGISFGLSESRQGTKWMSNRL